MKREPRTGRLAQCQRRPAVVDMVVGQDDPAQVGDSTTVVGDAAEDRPKTAGVAGVDDGEAVVTFEQIRLGAADPGNAGNQIRS